jgi:GTP-dependent phosphoenolpyruvate carboxykinase
MSEMGYELKHASIREIIESTNTTSVTLQDKHKMESRQMMEFLLAMREEARGNQANTDGAFQVMQEKAEIGRKEVLARLKSDRQTERNELKEMMEGMMHANETKTDAKLEDLTERKEKTQLELQTAEMYHDATTKKF